MHMLDQVSSSPRLVRSWLLAGLAMGLVSRPLAAAVLTHPGAPASAPDTACMPGFDVGVLPACDQGYLARRVMICGDQARGMITAAEYRDQVSRLDAAWTGTAAPPLAPVAPLLAVQWAATVRGVSSEYTATSWAAARVLGAPDVYPGHGDNAQAWASHGADDGTEWIEVGYDHPMPISAVKIFETYNPGAVSRVELITSSGGMILAYAGAAQPRGEAAYEHAITVSCTQEPIVAVRVVLDSQAVPGWNELDAIGLVPCAEQ